MSATMTTSQAPTLVSTDARTAPALHGLDQACHDFMTLTRMTVRDDHDRLHAVSARIHDLARALAACERVGLTAGAIRPHLADVRDVHAASPFVRRLQTWPRGYPGDFETVEAICDAENTAPVGTVAWGIEQLALHAPIAQQHRNKVALQGQAILRAVQARPDARILSIGCGGCRDLRLIAPFVPSGHGRFVLVDGDAAALAFARERLGALAARCEFVHGRVPGILGRVGRAAGFDLVVAGGLFDYLPERWAHVTLTTVRARLASEGRILLSNIAAGNPYRLWLEHLADWRLIERSEDELRRLMTTAGFAVSDIRVSRDQTGLALMVEATTAPSSSLSPAA